MILGRAFLTILEIRLLARRCETLLGVSGEEMKIAAQDVLPYDD